MRSSLVLVLVVSLAHADELLDVTRSAKLAAGTYTLSGRQTLPKGVRLTLQKGVKIVGEDEGAAIDVVGTLECLGAPGEEVVFQNIWLSLDRPFKSIRLSHTKMLGKGGVFTTHERQTIGKLFLEDVAFRDKASLWVIFQEGTLTATRVSSESSCQIAGTHTNRNFKLDVSDCFAAKGVSGFQGGFRLHNVKDVRLRRIEVGGIISSFRGCTKLLMEECTLGARSFTMRQDKKGRYAKTKILRCNFVTPLLKFHAPAGSRDKVTLTECHFKGDGATPPAEIATKRTKSENVRVTVKAPSPEPHALASAGG